VTSPRPVKRHRLAANATAFAELCLLLNDSEYTKEELSEKTGLVIGTVTKWMAILQRRKLVYICEWRKGIAGAPAAVWAWGYEKSDAPRPKPMTQAQYDARRRAKKRGTFGLGAM